MNTAQRRINALVRSRIGGPEFRRVHELIMRDGERWFTPADPIWRVHDDVAMVVGGMRALLLQALHPLAMQGVSDHSDFRADPWGRLHNTSRFLAFTTMGTIEDAERQIAGVRAVHRRVRGTTADGTPYSAGDPHLLAWVHAAEIDSFLSSHQAYSDDPLSPADADRYVAQTGDVASRLGVLEPPRSVAELAAVLASYRSELVLTPAAVEARDLLLRRPPVPLIARPGYDLIAAGAVALLPVYARVMLALPYRPIRRGLLGPALTGVAVRTLRWALEPVPDSA